MSCSGEPASKPTSSEMAGTRSRMKLYWSLRVNALRSGSGSLVVREQRTRNAGRTARDEEHEFTTEVDAGEIIVLEIGHREAEADEDHRRLQARPQRAWKRSHGVVRVNAVRKPTPH